MSESDKKISITKDRQIKIHTFVNEDGIEDFVPNVSSKKIFSFKNKDINNVTQTKNTNNLDLDYIIQNIDSFSVNQLKQSIKSLAIIIKNL